MPEDPQEIVKLAVKKSTEQAVLFYGKVSVYGLLDGWPQQADIVHVAETMRENATAFFQSLEVANWGFYLIDADDPDSSSHLRGTDFRCSQPRGICLILAYTFATAADYLQAKGRVRRGTDEGTVYEMQQDMITGYI